MNKDDYSYSKSYSPKKLLVMVILSVFFVEFGIMLAFRHFLTDFSYVITSLIDSLLLTIIIYPVIYYLVFKPLMAEMKQGEKFESLLMAANSDLEKFQLAVEAASDHIIITDSDGKIIYANPMAEKITGYTLEEMKGRRPNLWGGLMPKEFYEKMWDTIKNKKKVFLGELKNKRKNGEIYEAAVSLSPVLDAKGEAEFFVGIERDTTKEKQIERAKSEFLSLASHQLRTPLSATRWTLELFMEDENLSEKSKTRLKDLYDSNLRLIDLVNSLLNVSRIETGRLPINKKPANIAQLVEESHKGCLPNAEKKNQKITVSVNAEVKDTVIDPMLFSEAFNNLLSNAINYAPEGSAIDAAIDLKDGKYLVSVHNTGSVISDVDRDKLFNKFYRGVDSQTVKTEGSGLGLYIAKSAVEANGGTIGFESNKENGTTFYFTVPVK